MSIYDDLFDKQIFDARISYGTETIFGHEFDRNVRILASELEKKGINASLKVVLLGSNDVSWLIIYCALMHLNAVIIPFDVSDNQEKMLNKILFCNPNFIISNNFNFCKKLNLRQINIQTNNLTDFKLFVDLNAPKELLTNVATMVCSSGTGGSEKYIMISKQGLTSVIEFYQKQLLKKKYDSILNLLPLNPIYPLSVCLAAIFSGKRITFFKTEKDDLVSVMKENRVECIVGIPDFLEAVNDSIEKNIAQKPAMVRIVASALKSLNAFSLRIFKKNIGRYLFRNLHSQFNPSLRNILSGGATSKVATLKNLTYLGFSITEGYGLTECAGIVTMHNGELSGFGTCGKPLVDVELKICPQSKEILVKTPRLFEGYYRQPDLTEAAIVDGWLKTGDLGYFDHNHNLVISGRIKDVIVKGNEQKVLPGTVEAYFSHLSHLVKITVCGIPGPKSSGDKIVLFFTLNGSEDEKARVFEELNNTNKSLPKDIQVHDIVYVDNIPTNKLGKVCRYILSNSYASRTTPN